MKMNQKGVVPAFLIVLLVGVVLFLAIRSLPVTSGDSLAASSPSSCSDAQDCITILTENDIPGVTSHKEDVLCVSNRCEVKSANADTGEEEI
jgi:hypothetical protein